MPPYLARSRRGYDQRPMRWILAGGLSGLAAVLIGLAVMLTHDRPGSEREYAASTPDELIASAFEAIERGEADRLSDFVYAPTPEFRAVLDRLGALLGSLGDLASALDERFPADVAKLKVEAARGGGPGLGSLLGAVTGGGRGRGPGAGAGGAPGASQQASVEALLADPYGWADALKDRVSAVVIADDLAAVQVDGKPALGGLGMTLRRDDGRWWIDLPLELPMVKKYVPQTLEEHQVLGSMIKVVDNAVIDLTKDVRSGACRTLKDASGLAGEKAFPPLMMCVLAYDRAMAARAKSAP